jgi:hypothetical protein
MRKKILVLLLIPLLFVSVVQAGDWKNCITTDTHTWCIIGEKQNASDGIDQYDAPHPPFFPPGRCFVFLKEESFEAPYYNLIIEYKQHAQSKVFNLSCFWYPMWTGGSKILLNWDSDCFARIGYKTITLQPIGINMLKEHGFMFWSEAYQMTYFQVICSQ